MATRTAGAAGSIEVRTKNLANQFIVPVSVPVVKWYTDVARTAGELTLPTTGSGSTYTSTWTAAQAPPATATRYIHITIEVSPGVYDIDANDHIEFVDASAEIGNAYFSLTELRSFDPAFADSATYTDTDLARVLNEVEASIEAACGAAFVPRTVTETLDGRGTAHLSLGHMYPRTPIISAATTINGVVSTLTAAELAEVVLYDRGEAVRLSLGTWPVGYRNVSITYRHGFDSPAAAPMGHLISRAARELFRAWMRADKTPTDPSLSGVRSLSVEGYSVNFFDDGKPRTGNAEADRLIGQWKARDGVVGA